MSTSVRQVSYDLMCQMLRSVLRDGVQSAEGKPALDCAQITITPNAQEVS
jgi:hypothetical protein